MPENPGRAGNRQIIHFSDEAASCRLAEDIAAVLQPGDLVALSGDLGSGKTLIARAMIRSASGDPGLEVPSPTFPIRIDYLLPRLTIAHVDLYRIGGEDDALELGLDEALDDAALIVEWPERLNWPEADNRLDLTIRTVGDNRQAVLEAYGNWPLRLEKTRRIRKFLDHSGCPDAQRLHVVGDVSDKSFERVVDIEGNPAILMNSPARPAGPPVWHGRTYDDVAHRAIDVLPFLAIASALRNGGFHVPHIRAADRPAGLVLMEDLGSETIAGQAGYFTPDRYEAAIDLLSELHRQTWPEELTYDGENYCVPRYDLDALLIEIDLYGQWYLPRIRQAPVSGNERNAFLDAWREALAVLNTFQDCWVMRDFHSPNILWQPEETGIARLGIIDIQDTLVGHPAYDVASLAQDARVDISTQQEAGLFRRYCAARCEWDADFDEGAFMRAYAVLGAQRATKVLGAFTRLTDHDGRSEYGVHIPRVKTILARNLADPVLSGVRDWYQDMI